MKVYKRPMLKSLETRGGMDDAYDESFLPLIAKGRRNRKKYTEKYSNGNKESRGGRNIVGYFNVAS